MEISVSDHRRWDCRGGPAEDVEEIRQVGDDYARRVEGSRLGLTLTKKFVECTGERSG